MNADTLTKDESIRLMQAEIERLRAENYRLSEELKETSRLYSAMRFERAAYIQGEAK